jgi:hypothetical protein
MPAKEAYKRLASNPELEFEFFLGEKLGKTVAEIRAIDNAEFVHWCMYYGRKAQQQELASKMRG